MSRPSRAAASNARCGILCLLILTLMSSSSMVTAETPSGCDVCATTGDCSHAYLNTPGHACSPWLDQNNQKRNCCCPTDAVCKNNNYDCRCTRLATTPAPTKADNGSSGGSSSSFAIPTGAALAAFVVLSLAACYFFKQAKRRTPPNPGTTPPPVVGAGVPGANVVPMAQPVVYAPQSAYYPYATTPSAPVYSYGNEYNYHHHHHHSETTSAVVGTVAGLATGMIIADVVSDGFGSSSGDGGFSGDSGGYSGGYDGGGADSGGGGGDFGGDF